MPVDSQRSGRLYFSPEIIRVVTIKGRSLLQAVTQKEGLNEIAWHGADKAEAIATLD